MKHIEKWLELGLTLNEKGAPYCNLNNVLTVIQKDETFKRLFPKETMIDNVPAITVYFQGNLRMSGVDESTVENAVLLIEQGV